MPSMVRRRDEIRVVACLFSNLFLGVADNQILSPLLPAIRTHFGRSSSEAGLLFTGYAFCAGISVLIWGPVSDRFGRKRGLLNGLIVFCAGSGLSYVSSDFQTLLAGRILTGMGASMLSLNTISYAADFFPYATRGWAMGSIFSSYFAALILGVPIGSWMGDAFGWNAVFGTMGIIALLLILAVQLLLPGLAARSVDGRRTPIPEYLRKYLAFMRTPSSMGALFSSFFASAGTMGFLAFLGVWLHDQFGIQGSRVGLIFLVAGAAALLASPLAGSVSDRIGKRLQFIVSSAALALFLLILPRLHWGALLFGVFGLLSLSAAFRQGPMEAVLTEIVSADSRGTFIALKNSFSQLGIGIAALLSGILFERQGYSGVCSLGAISCLLAACAMAFTYKNRDL
jgi:MFS transporter, DHA1 family, inner membrane transport protein